MVTFSFIIRLESPQVRRPRLKDYKPIGRRMSRWLQLQRIQVHMVERVSKIREGSLEINLISRSSIKMPVPEMGDSESSLEISLSI